MNRNRIIEGCYLSTDSISSVYVKLKPNKALFPGHFIPPVIWSGIIQNQEIEIIQVSNHAYSQSDFKFIKYPKEFDDLKNEIIKGIDDAMRVMD